jgi:hypothetical protein
MGTKGTISTRAVVSSALVCQPLIFVMAILVCLHPKAGMAFLNESPFGAGGGGKVFPTPGTPRALYTGYGSMPT